MSDTFFAEQRDGVFRDLLQRGALLAGASRRPSRSESRTSASERRRLHQRPSIKRALAEELALYKQEQSRRAAA